VTFYGWADNSPLVPANAFDCERGKWPDSNPIAGGMCDSTKGEVRVFRFKGLIVETGTGTFDDPISFATATDNKSYPQCGIVYVPSLHK